MSKLPKFDPSKAHLAASYEVPGILFALSFDEEQRMLYGAGTDNAVHRVEIDAEKPAAEKRWSNHDSYVSCLAFVDGNAVSGGFDRKLIWTNAESGEKIRAVEAHDGWVRDIAVFAGGHLLASVGDDMLVKIWNAKTGELVHVLDGHAKQTPEGYATALYAVAATPDGRFLASADRIGDVCVWEVASRKLIHRLHAPTFYTYDAKKRVRSIGGIRSLCFSPDGSRLAIAGIGQVTNVDGFVGPCRLELWDWNAAKRLYTGTDGHKAVLNHVLYHPIDSVLIAAGGGDGGGVLGFWDQQKPKPIHKVKPKGHIQQFALDAIGARLYAAGFGGFQIWNLYETDKPAQKKAKAVEE